MSDKSSTLANLGSTIRAGIENRLKDLHTSMPGIISAFDPATQLASVQPAIRRVFKSEEADGVETLIPVDLPLLINVPVHFVRGGGFSMTFPVAVGDECLLVFCERSIDEWYTFGGVRDPGARRFHALSDAIAFVGISSAPNAIPSFATDGVEIKKDDGTAKITLGDGGSIRLENSSGFVELQADGLFNINGIIFSLHVHPQGNDSAGNVQVNTGVAI